MPLTVYAIPPSPPVRAIFMCAKALDLTIDKKFVDLRKGEHLTPNYLKLNPQHTVPVLDDDGFILTDSHAILTYLVSKYGKDDSLYPKDLRKRAIVDQRLYFESSVLFARGSIIVKRLFRDGLRDIPPPLLEAVEEAYDFTEIFLDQNEFIAGDHPTIADFSFVTSITSFNVFVPFTDTKYPNIAAWLRKMEHLPYYSENQVGLDVFMEVWKTS